MASLRMNAMSSPTGTVKRACSNTKKTAMAGAPVPASAVLQEESKEVEKYIHVHHFKQTGLFGAWFNDPSVEGNKVRLFFGSHLTAYLAARAQDRAALKYRPSALNPKSVKLNFKEEDYVLDEGLRATMENEEFGELLRCESRPTYKKMEPTPLLRFFMAEERAAGNLPRVVPNKAKPKKLILLEPYLINVLMNREEPTEIPDFSFLKEAYKEAYEALSLKGIEDQFLKVRGTAASVKPVDHGVKLKTNKRRRAMSPRGREKECNKRPRQELTFVPMKFKNVIALNAPRALRSSSAKPLATTPVSTVAVAKPKSVKQNIEKKLVWFPQRPGSILPTRLASRSVEFMVPGNARNKLQYKLQKVEFMAPGNARNKLQYKLQKVDIMAPNNARNKLQYKLEKVDATRARELILALSLSIPAQVEEVVPMVEEMVPMVKERQPKVEEKESRAFNFNLFMLADVLALQE